MEAFCPHTPMEAFCPHTPFPKKGREVIYNDTKKKRITSGLSFLFDCRDDLSLHTLSKGEGCGDACVSTLLSTECLHTRHMTHSQVFKQIRRTRSLCVTRKRVDSL